MTEIHKCKSTSGYNSSHHQLLHAPTSHNVSKMETQPRLFRTYVKFLKPYSRREQLRACSQTEIMRMFFNQECDIKPIAWEEPSALTLHIMTLSCSSYLWIWVFQKLTLHNLNYDVKKIVSHSSLAQIFYLALIPSILCDHTHFFFYTPKLQLSFLIMNAQTTLHSKFLG